MDRINLDELDKQIKAVAPSLIGISIGKRDDKSTWKLQFSSEPTSDQLKSASVLMETFELKVISQEQMEKPSRDRKARLASVDISQLPPALQPILKDLIDEITK